MKHSLKITQNNQMICQYCNSICLKNHRDRRYYHWWWKCQKCKVNFLVSLKGCISIVEFELLRQPDKFYSIALLLKEKETVVYIWKKILDDEDLKWSHKYRLREPDYNCHIVTSLDYIIDLNFENLEKKFKTIVTFS